MDDGYHSPHTPQRQPHIDRDRPVPILQVEEQIPTPPRHQQPPKFSSGHPLAPENTDNQAHVPTALRQSQEQDRNSSKRSAPALPLEYVPKPYKHPRVDDHRPSPPPMRRDTTPLPLRSPYSDDRRYSPDYSESFYYSEGFDYSDGPDRPDIYYRVDDMVDQLPENKAWALLKFLENAREDDWAALERPPRREGGEAGRYNRMGVMVTDASGVTININNNSNGDM